MTRASSSKPTSSSTSGILALYYVLACYGPADQDRAAIGQVRNTKLNWQMGQRFASPPPSPVQVDLNPDFPGIMLPMFDKGVLLFAQPMLESIEAAGVDNLETFSAILHDPQSGNRFDNYKAINIVGTVAAANLGESQFTAPSGTPIVDVDFDSLAIDEAKAGSLLMFRLAECVTAIIIHDRVKQQLERDGIPHLNFVDPKDFVG